MGIKVASAELGSDPELFASRNGFVVGSERLVPEEGLSSWTNGPKVIRDGVQIELNLRPFERREALGEDITAAFIVLKKRLQGTDFKMKFDPVVMLSKAELDSLSEASRRYGCVKSYNLYGLSGPTADPSTYLFRSAGGHVHLGLFAPIFERSNYTVRIVKDEEQNDVEERLYEVDKRRQLTGLMDVIVGNTCVLLDRDLLAPERRKNYGKVGEFRLPNHGLEYRTLSNFWLRNYSLFSLVMGLSRLAVSVLHTSLTTNENLEEELLGQVDFGKVITAIQENDLALAHETWDIVKEFIRKHGDGLGDMCGLNPGLLDKFELFVKKVGEYGLDYWFPEDPMMAWTSERKVNWEDFLRMRVR